MKNHREYLDLIELKASQHKENHGTVAELDFGGGATWMMNIIMNDLDSNQNKRVIEELESILDKTQLATKVDSIRSHIAYRNTEYKLKQD